MGADWTNWPERAAAIRTVFGRGWADAVRFKDTYQWETITAVLAVIAAVVWAPPDDASFLSRATVAVMALAVGLLAGFLFCLLWQTVNAPRRQGDELRNRVAVLEAELDRRDEIRFSLEPSTEVLGELHPWRLDETPDITVTYTHNVAFWVRVHNRGPTADFAAQLLHIAGLPDRAGSEELVDGNMDEVAWEHTIEPIKTITQGGRARLRLANYAGEPRAPHPFAPCFWFFGATSAVWSPGKHQVGWRHRGHWVVKRSIEFDLVVTDVTHGQSRIQHARIGFGEPGESPTFSFDGPLRIFDSGEG